MLLFLAGTIVGGLIGITISLFRVSGASKYDDEELPDSEYVGGSNGE